MDNFWTWFILPLLRASFVLKKYLKQNATVTAIIYFSGVLVKAIRWNKSCKYQKGDKKTITSVIFKKCLKSCIRYTFFISFREGWFLNSISDLLILWVINMSLYIIHIKYYCFPTIGCWNILAYFSSSSYNLLR